MGKRKQKDSVEIHVEMFVKILSKMGREENLRAIAPTWDHQW